MKKRQICLLLTTLLLNSGLAWGQKAEHLNLKINSQLEERQPTPSPDGKTLYFWRRANPDNTGGIEDPGDIWRSEHLTGSNWTQAERLGPPFNTPGHDFVWQVSATGDTLWINQVPEGTRGHGLKYLVRDRFGRWSQPKRAYILGFNYQGQYKDYSLSPQGYMLIPNEGSPSYGGTDLYVCFPVNDTTWGRPINLGPAINTPGDEDAPRIAPDGKTLYFGSNGHGGKGGHDIFVSYRLDETWQRWTTPENIGAPVNTPGYEFDFIVAANGEYAWWGSSEGSYGKNDIFRMPLNTCEVDIYPAGDQNLCIGETVELEAGFAPGQAITYQWLRDGRAIPGARDRRLLVDQEGDYQVMRSRPGCEITSAASRVRYVQAPRVTLEAASNLICPEDSIQLRAYSTLATGFRWRKNNLEIPGATGPVYYALTPGIYTVEAMNFNCGALSQQVRLGAFERPRISLATDSVEAKERTLLPKWLWNNKAPLAKGSVFVKDMASTPGGDAFMLTLASRKKGKYTQQVARFFSDGVFRKILAEAELEDASDRFIAADNLGNFFITGNDRYLTKYRPDGRIAWQKAVQMEKVTGIATDPLDFVITTGRYQNDLVIEDERYPAAQRSSMYVAKHDPQGELVWVRTLAVDWFEYDFGNAVHTDCEGNVYVAGGFRTIANFGDGNILRTSLKGDSFFLAKYSPDGELIWTQRVDIDKNRIRTHDSHTDCEGSTYLVLGTNVLIYDREGGLQWQGSLETPDTPRSLRIAATTNGDIYVQGITQKSEVFIAKINKIKKQIILWQSKGGSGELGDLPAIAADAKGSVFFAANTGSRVPPGLAHEADNKAPVYIARYGPPQLENMNKTITICKGESVVFYSDLEPGSRYQWLLNGSPVSGATSHAFTATRPGDYQVSVMSGECQQISGIQRVDNNCDDRPVLATREEPAPAPRPVPVVEPIRETPPPPAANSPVRVDGAGRPKSLYDRRVKKQGEIVIRGEEVSIAVWDHRAVDNDTISLNVNGEWLLREYGLTKKQEEIHVRFRRGQENFIILYAHNLGAIPPNTAQISIDDGILKQSIKLESNLRSCGMLRVRFE